MKQTLIPVAIAFCLLVFTSVNRAQTTEIFLPGKPITISLSPDEARAFSLEMKADDYAEVTWLANDNLVLSFGFLDSSGKVISLGDSTSNDSAVFIAPKAGKYSFLVKYDKSPELTGQQRVSLEYSNKFSLPKGSKQKDIRRINGFDVRIMYAPDVDQDYGDNVVLFEKSGILKGILRQGGNATYMGFSFPDNAVEAKTLIAKKQVNLIRNTLDKTGDRIPDVMIDYFSGGAHCCFSTYFVNLADAVDVLEVLNTDNASLAVIGVNPKGGLRFATNENAFAYWNIHYAGSPMPDVILEFQNGELRPNFELMKKPAPSLARLKAKARAASLKISNDLYNEVGMDFEEAFWSEMLDLIYSGHEDLAWQYFELVWPTKKTGKEKFTADFKEALAESYYGTRAINTSNSMRNSMRLFEKIYKGIREQ
ncbi:MAG: hypothetical protein WBD27_03355 [Pyrinomonadaceae bacterium]